VKPVKLTCSQESQKNKVKDSEILTKVGRLEDTAAFLGRQEYRKG
jgi:hypothetical protein